MNRSTLLAATLFFLAAGLLQAQDANPIDPAETLSALAELERKHLERRETALGNVVRQIATASASPAAATDLYEQAIMLTQFEGQNRENTMFRDWKKKETEKLRDKSFQVSTQLHLRYLALTLRRAAGEEIESLLPDLIAYTGDAFSAQESPGFHREMLEGNRPVTRSLFVEAFHLQSALGKLEGWEPQPANIDGIFEKSILPTLRTAKDPRAAAYWERRIGHAEKLATEANNTFATERFTNFTKPSLLWSRAREFRHLGQPNRGIQEMLAVVRAFPDHPDFAQWAGELRTALAPPAPASPEGTD